MKRVLRDAVAVALVSGLTFQALRHWVGDRYLVPSGSMQPTLFGAEQGGDIVFVDKLAAAASLRRYDLGVFRMQGEGRELVKRVVAFGDDPMACCLELRGGDLWLGPDAQRLQRAQKDPLDSRDLRVPWLAWPTAANAERDDLADLLTRAGGALLLPRFEDLTTARSSCTEASRRALGVEEVERGDRTGGGWLATVRPVDAGYLDAYGNRRTEGANLLVDDVGGDVTFAAAGVEGLLVGLDLRPDSWVFHWQPATGMVALWRNGETVAEHRWPAVPAEAAASATTRVEFGLLDGRFFFAVDGRRELLWIEPRRLEWVVADPGPAVWSMPKNRVRLAVLGAAPAPVRSLQVFHDLHWYRPNIEIGVDPAHFSPVRTVPPGHVFLLGDNAADSRDGRMFGPTPIAGFVGRPRLILGPWPRWHWLDR